MHGNVEAILGTSGASYEVHLHEEMPFPIHSPQDFARALGRNVARITKTLFLRATDRKVYCLVVLSSHSTAELDEVAELLEVKRVQMASREQLARVLNYPATGVSPITHGSMPVFIDQGLMSYPTALTGARRVGVEIQVSPQVLRQVTDGEVLPLA